MVLNQQTKETRIKHNQTKIIPDSNLDYTQLYIKILGFHTTTDKEDNGYTWLYKDYPNFNMKRAFQKIMDEETRIIYVYDYKWMDLDSTILHVKRNRIIHEGTKIIAELSWGWVSNIEL